MGENRISATAPSSCKWMSQRTKEEPSELRIVLGTVNTLSDGDAQGSFLPSFQVVTASTKRSLGGDDDFTRCSDKRGGNKKYGSKRDDAEVSANQRD